MAKREEGQIWIGKEVPNVLKYYANNTEYWVETALTYYAAPGTSIKKGQLLAISDTGEENVKPALWPRDANSLVGIALNDANSPDEVRAVNYGYISIENPENCFVTEVDLKTGPALDGYSSTLDGQPGGNGWEGINKGIGQPVYWFTGKALKSGASSYPWVDSSNYKGKLTFSTPSGYKPNRIDESRNDDSFNVTYKQLPIVGTVVKYEETGNVITSLVLHVNFTTFNNKIQFEYPAQGLGYYSEQNKPETIKIRHGLFPDVDSGPSPTGNIFIPHVNLKVWGYEENSASPGEGEKQTMDLYPGFDSYLAGDKRTEVEFVSDTAFHYKIVGEVNYNF